MNKAIAAGILVTCLVPFAAHAQERAGDAALGALSGAIVFGPVGAVAGALVGYTAGPDIARSWRLRSPGRRPQGHSAHRSVPKAASAKTANSARSASPPSTAAPAPPAASPGKTAGSTGSANGMPPVQTLE